MASVSFNSLIIENHAIKYFNGINLNGHFFHDHARKEFIYFSSVQLRISLEIALKLHFYTSFVNMLAKKKLCKCEIANQTFSQKINRISIHL